VKKVYKKILPNGLTVLVSPVKLIPKVSLQMWYDVGSKHEKAGERGLAHLLEHMIFKGTKTLSEGDLDSATRKLSGYCNAFTSYDYTGYVFDFPTNHWPVALTLFADCMSNCTLSADILNAELKAVIQELKLYKDDYQSTLVEELISAIFIHHPYHYPVIGYKKDLFDITHESLMNFYKQHYTPNNATLVVVGDVEPEDVFNKVHEQFASMPSGDTSSKKATSFFYDKKSRSVTLYREIAQPLVIVAFVVPGLVAQNEHVLEVAAWLMGNGRNSRLYQALVEKTMLAADIQAFVYDLFDANILAVAIQPTDVKHIPTILNIVRQEIDQLYQGNFDTTEVERAYKQATMAYYSVFENLQRYAYALGKTYSATGDESYLFRWADYDVKEIESALKSLFATYTSPTVMYWGQIVPLHENEKEQWTHLQQKSDQADSIILDRKVRQSPVIKSSFIDTITAREPRAFTYPKATEFVLNNGLKVFYYHDDRSPKIELILDLKVDHCYDPEDKKGLCNFVSEMLQEGTKNYTAYQLADLLESRGILLSVLPGCLTMTLPKQELAFALQIVEELMINATFEQNAFKKIKEQIKTEVAQHWDNPDEFAIDLALKEIYKKHPYGATYLGTKKDIERITVSDVASFYKEYFSPYGARLAIVGDIADLPIKKIVEQGLDSWQALAVKNIECPPIKSVKSGVINYPINRDQVVLVFAGLSVKRTDPDYDALCLFEQALLGGVLGSMGDYLFHLREQTGLFYTIGGSLVYQAEEDKGLIFIRTLVSLDKLEQASQLIKKTMLESIDKFGEYELQEAKNALSNSLMNSFEAPSQIAQVFLFLNKYGLPHDYFDTRAQQLQKISLEQVKTTVKKYINADNLIELRIGRI
jgi:zinc protease